MQAALAEVKRALGPDAVILGTRSIDQRLGGILGGGRVEITAARAMNAAPSPRAAARTPESIAGASAYGIPEQVIPVRARQSAPALDEPRPWQVPQVNEPNRRIQAESRVAPSGANGTGRAAPPARQDAALSADWLRYYQRLLSQEVSAVLADRIIRGAAQRLRSHEARNPEARRAAIVEQLRALFVTPSRNDTAPAGRQVIALVGPPGSGKTTTIAKLAARYALQHRRRVKILSLDSYRLANHEQIQKFGALIGVTVLAAQTPAAVAAALASGADGELILLDTPGVGLRDAERFQQLTGLLDAAQPTETQLVLQATWSDAAQGRAVQRFGQLVRGAGSHPGTLKLVLTHLDETLGLGAALGAAQRLQLEMVYYSDGQSVPRDLHPAAPEALAAELLGMA